MHMQILAGFYVMKIGCFTASCSGIQVMIVLLFNLVFCYIHKQEHASEDMLSLFI